MAFQPPVTVAPGHSLFNCECSALDGQFSPTMSFGGKLYMCCTDFDLSTLAVYRSTDSGATWGRMDAAHEPTFVDNNSFQTEAAGFFCVVNQNPGPHFFFVKFDCATELWGSLGAATTFTAELAKGIWKNAAGDYCFLFTDNSGPTQTISLAKNTAGVWGVPFTVSNNNTTNGGGNGHVANTHCAGAMNGNTLLLNYTSFVTPTTTWHSMYQEIDTSADTLGYFQDMYNDTTNAVAAGSPGVLGSNVVVPSLINNLADPQKRTIGIFSGPIGGPLVVSGPIDPGFPGDPNLYVTIINVVGYCAVQAGTLALTYCGENQAGTKARGRCRYLTTTDRVTWTGETVFDNSATPSIDVVRIATVAFGSPPMLDFIAVIGGVQGMFFSPFGGGGGPGLSPILSNPTVVVLPNPARNC